MTVFGVDKLARHHAIDGFDCGQESLNRFLTRFALPSQQAHASQTYLGLTDAAVVGFYTLVVSEVANADAPDRLTNGLAHHPVPLMLLARLAVSATWQGKGSGPVCSRMRCAGQSWWLTSSASARSPLMPAMTPPAPSAGTSDSSPRRPIRCIYSS